MKRLALAGLCALLFAGHAMAQTTCSNATLTGTYAGISTSGTLAGLLGATAIPIYIEAQVKSNGTGTATANINYTTVGGAVSSGTTESVTFTINSDCSLTGSAVIAGIPATLVGHINPSGDTAYVVSQTVGIGLNGVLHKVD
ncbi:hypothetical protein [Dyella nitratireducens]|uniref:Uncharacterized protein n=1 Tax=Dyella nitratireducens TaxID=1849580 RepID=A0ABQ1FNS2_9GAMM|nr:hypothetical protein [Dyella nitratireducens]GGA22785.1 hypothetical protein GCM10010981_08750 [Dyella nitratireducens]GLQ44065.1 hypothetical protein GCM10007902_39150 [Dyella nitratireducens]